MNLRGLTLIFQSYKKYHSLAKRWEDGTTDAASTGTTSQIPGKKRGRKPTREKAGQIYAAEDDNIKCERTDEDGSVAQGAKKNAKTEGCHGPWNGLISTLGEGSDFRTSK